MLSSLIQSYTFFNDAVNDLHSLRSDIASIFAWGGTTKQEHCYFDWQRSADEILERAAEHAESFRSQCKELIAHGDYVTDTQYTEKAIIAIFGLYGDSVDEYLAGRLKYCREIKEAVGKEEESGLKRQYEQKAYKAKENKSASVIGWGVVIVGVIIWLLVR